MKALAVKGPRCEGKDNVVVVDGGGGDGARRSQRRQRKNRMPTENGTGIRSRQQRRCFEAMNRMGKEKKWGLMLKGGERKAVGMKVLKTSGTEALNKHFLVENCPPPPGCSGLDFDVLNRAVFKLSILSSRGPLTS
ncbi:hypothetical protein V6N11_012303 [Hibiscus sabdariffa]|uniref:Uncharacterized protein n=1 Tax=Hibiscus sabdariffa TaxID=183260 RepID=A0ABR2QAQ6_9ROSI